MKLLVSGCSFTASNFWTLPLKINHTIVKNLAVPSAGNNYIANSIMFEDLDSYDCAVVMWSGITRLDALVEDISYFSRYSYKKNIDANNGYICAGSRLGGWNGCDRHYNLLKGLFEEQFKTKSDENLATLSLLEIIKLQNFLKVNNKQYLFCTYLNYWKKDKDWKSRDGDFGVNNILGLSKFIKQIDFSNWIFTEGFDGYYEIAKENNFFEKDGHHPNLKAGMIWGNLINERLNLKGNKNESNTLE